MVSQLTLNYFKNEKQKIISPISLYSKGIHFIQSNAVIATFQKIIQWIRSFFHYFSIRDYLIANKERDISLKTKAQPLPLMIEKWRETHSSVIKKATGLVMLFGTIYALYKIFPYSKTLVIPSQSSNLEIANPILNGFPIVVISLLLLGFYSFISKYGQVSPNEQFHNLLQATNQTKDSDEIISEMEKLLKRGAEINYKNPNGNFFLHVAISPWKKPFPEILKFLLSQNDIDVNVKDSLGETPLHHAVFSSSIQSVQLLLNHKKIKINEQEKEGYTPLHLAAQNNKKEIVELFIDHVDMNSESDIEINKKNEDENTPLHLAALMDHEEIIERLIKHKSIKINEQNKNGDTPLHLAIRNNQISSMEILINNKADLSITNNEGELAVDLAESKENKEFITKLIENIQKDDKQLLA